MVLAVTTIGTIFYSIIVFLLVIITLVGLLLFARDKLTPKGDVELQINDRKRTVSPGSNLLFTLSSNNIFLPSACGGGEHAVCANAR